MSSEQQDLNDWYESLALAVRKLHEENSRYTGPAAPPQHQRVMAELQNVPTTRPPKRHHVESPVDVLISSVPQEYPVCKRQKRSERPEDEGSEAAVSPEGSGWRCVIL
ncbi:hypothetical protein GDO81_024976 [Engystomops pustulosus]|uniref:PH domain-containing protein n=1 Tax=Engystomops pustulosus TaxID=76066 RepID=A0AAV6Z7H2_ENGPU|nr:hypothetical protein GDO81_024976 [Engystomops pustulosus]